LCPCRQQPCAFDAAARTWRNDLPPSGADRNHTSLCGLGRCSVCTTPDDSQAGTFPYYCSVHFSLGMTGTITVQ